ncbi:MAG TPA: tetratricopeptide repeat protein [Bryobacteraceae bacterium]
MIGFLKAWQWHWVRSPNRESWGLDRNWHRSEAGRHLKSGNFPDAERHLSLAVREADERGIAPAQRVGLRLELASLQRQLAEPAPDSQEFAQLDMAKLRESENTLREAIIVCTQASDSKLYLRSLDALAEIFAVVEDYQALEEVTRDAVRLAASIANEDPQRVDNRLQRLATAQDRNGRFPDALKTFDQAIAVREKRFGAGHTETGNLLAEVGRICRARGVHPQAQAYLKRALRIHETQCGADSLEALADVQQLAGSLEDIGDLDGAATQYERALGQKLRKLGCENLDEVADMEYSLACLHIGWGHYSRARELLLECVGGFQRAKGPRLAIAYESLAHVEEREGRVSFALNELERAAKIWEKCTPPRLEEWSRNLDLQADLSEHLRLRVEANILRKKARHLQAAAEDQAALPEST